MADRDDEVLPNVTYCSQNERGETLAMIKIMLAADHSKLVLAEGTPNKFSGSAMRLEGEPGTREVIEFTSSAVGQPGAEGRAANLGQIIIQKCNKSEGPPVG